LIGRSILVIAVAALAGVQVVRNAAVRQFAETDPQLAARAWSTHPASEMWLGLTQIGLSARNRSPVTNDTLGLVWNAARKAPLAPEPFLVRGVQAQVAGDRSTAEQAFVAAKARDGRSIPARYFLAEQFFRSGDAPRGLREIAVLAKTVPNGVANLAPFVGAYAKDPRNRPQLQALFRSDPMLEEAALTTLASDPNNADLIRGLATPSAKTPAWAGTLVRSLVAAGQYEAARRVWAETAHVAPAGQGAIFDAGFADSDAPPPFNWALTSSTVGIAERQPGGRLHVLFYGQEDGALASQLLLLKPGHYRLAMRIAGDPARTAALSWKLTCADSKAVLADVPLSQAQRFAAGVPIEVPVNCAAQTLELLGSAPEVAEQVDVTISRLALAEQPHG